MGGGGWGEVFPIFLFDFGRSAPPTCGLCFSFLEQQKMDTCGKAVTRYIVLIGKTIIVDSVGTVSTWKVWARDYYVPGEVVRDSEAMVRPLLTEEDVRSIGLQK